MVFAEEFGYHGVPDNGTRAFGVGMLGPTLIVHGSEQQKREHLPRITSAEAVWCQGYSEPGSGSDLASLQTRAIRDGDDFVLNGQKIWTSGGHGANWIFVLARSAPEAPKHKGISFFMVDMRAPASPFAPSSTWQTPRLQRSLLRRRACARSQHDRQSKPWLVRPNDPARLRTLRRGPYGVTAAQSSARLRK